MVSYHAQSFVTGKDTSSRTYTLSYTSLTTTLHRQCLPYLYGRSLNHLINITTCEPARAGVGRGDAPLP